MSSIDEKIRAELKGLNGSKREKKLKYLICKEAGWVALQEQKIADLEARAAEWRESAAESVAELQLMEKMLEEEFDQVYGRDFE